MSDEFRFRVPPDTMLTPAYVGDRKNRRNSWANIIRTVTNMTVQEARQYFGESLEVLDTFTQDKPIRELMILRAVVDFMQDPSPAMLNLLMEREEGKVEQKVSGDLNINVLDWKALAEQMGVTEAEAIAEAKNLLAQLEQKETIDAEVKLLPEETK